MRLLMVAMVVARLGLVAMKMMAKLVRLVCVRVCALATVPVP